MFIQEIIESKKIHTKDTIYKTAALEHAYEFGICQYIDNRFDDKMFNAEERADLFSLVISVLKKYKSIELNNHIKILYDYDCIIEEDVILVIYNQRNCIIDSHFKLDFSKNMSNSIIYLNTMKLFLKYYFLRGDLI